MSEVFTQLRVEGIRKLRDAGVEHPGAAFLWFEDVECGKDPRVAFERVSNMGRDARLEIGRRSRGDVRVNQGLGETNRHAPNVIDASGLAASSDPDREKYLQRKYGLKYHTDGTHLGTMRLDKDGHEIPEGR